ncbi:amino acid adenylation domain-containing protein [Vibrio cidicii]|uniref:amino acid adenylation domain-containing protein n=1 Tax=Vibrio cidicii TaxID=1763883 RepID=UPI0018C27C4C|nr:amino acid adenylation domain-containing protein [Vibrio cidicii]
MVFENRPQELTPMQAAYWVGRESQSSLGGQAAHLYTEFDSQALDVNKLRAAVQKLFRVHPMLRVMISPQGQQSIAPCNAYHQLQIHDLRRATEEQAEARLAEIRQQMSHQKMQLSHGQAADFRLSLLPGQRTRLHIDLDMIAADAQSFRLILQDLASLYHDVEAISADEECRFLAFVAQNAPVTSCSRHWWQQRLADIAPAPSFPYLEASPRVCQTQRLAAHLNASEHNQLQQLARRHSLTLTQLTLAVFAKVLAQATQQVRFRLNVPMFYRSSGELDISRVVGDFSRLMLLSVDLSKPQSLLQLAQAIRAELHQIISYSDYPGVHVMRDLSRHHGQIETSPVVFTSGVDLPGETLQDEPSHALFGEMVWAISQGAHVTLDAQIATTQQGLLLNWDVRMDCFPAGFVESLFAAYHTHLQALASDAQHIHRPLQVSKSKPLSTLQQAYLLGRGEQLPLGGVGMHDFREFHGTLAADFLQQRLASLVAHYPFLRTKIDQERLEQSVSDEHKVNLQRLDLSHLNLEHAQLRLQRLRHEYRQRVYDLNQSPWQVAVIEVPSGMFEQGNTVVFTSVDALIADGRAISRFISDLFSHAELKPSEHIEEDAPSVATMELRQQDEAYWRDKLAKVTGAPNLPWRQPLSAIRCATYRRQSRRISPQALKTLSQLGAQERLFANSLLSSLVLESLSLWHDGSPLCVGLPVAIPKANQPLGNHSTFVALVYEAQRESWLERAKRLQQDVVESLDHLHFSGVDLNRCLLNQTGATLAMPIVLTNTMSWSQPSLESGMHYVDGVTQTPQVAMDIRLGFDQQRHLLISIDYAEQALHEEMVTAWLDTLERMIAMIVERQSLQLESYQALSLAHYQSNRDENEFVCSGFLQRIHQHLYRGSEQAVAIVYDDQTITYRQLGEQVAQLRQHFVAQGLKPGQVVAICLPRSPEYVVSMLACALSGLIWVPIDVRSPAERLDYLLSNCEPAIIIASESLPQAPAPVWLIDTWLARDVAVNASLERDYAAASQDEKASYYLYTSGTTGKPKCVVLNNKATSHVIAQTMRRWQLTAQDVLMSVTPLHHDMSVFDLLGALTAGAKLVMPHAEHDKNALVWNQLVQQHQVSIWCSVPAILEMLLACEMVSHLKSLRLVAQGGDYIKPQTIAYLRRYYPELTLFSLGGPTETTIWSIWHQLTAQDVQQIPYGQPLPATQYYIVDDELRHCPPYKVGRIVTAGVNLSLGYLQNGQIGQSDFIDVVTPAGDKVRAFRTGDQGYYRQDGTIIFASRVSGYVKVRGVRVSLPDIEREVRQCPNLQEAIVLDFQEPTTQDTALVVLYTSLQGRLESAAIRQFIQQRLPVSHLPNHYHQLASLPLSANGKIDRAKCKAEWLAQAHPPRFVSQLRGKEEHQTPIAQFDGDYAPILQAYAQALNVNVATLNPQSDWLDAGLRCRHLTLLTKALNQRFGLQLQARQLAGCQNAQQVAELLFA